MSITDNILTTLPEGVFQGLSRLNEIDLTNNHIASFPETVFQNLTSLSYLFLGTGLVGLGAAGNFVTAVAKGSFQGLFGLTTLDLSYNHLAAVPERLFRHLTALETVQLDHNRITFLRPGTFAGLTALCQIKIGHNLVTSLPGGLFRGLPAIHDLEILENRITSLQIQIVDPGIGHLGTFASGSNTGLQSCDVDRDADNAVFCGPLCSIGSSTTAVREPSTALLPPPSPAGNSTPATTLSCVPFRLDPAPPTECIGMLDDFRARYGSLQPVFFVSQTVKIPGLDLARCNATDLFDRVYPGDVAKLSYDVVFRDEHGNRIASPGGSSPIVNRDTASVWITPELTAIDRDYYATVVAQDTSDHRVPIVEWNFTVKVNTEAGLRHDGKVRQAWPAPRGGEGSAQQLGWNARSKWDDKWAVGTSYSIAPVNRTGFAYNGVALGDASLGSHPDGDLTFTLSPVPDGFGINPATGAIFGTPTVEQFVNSTVYAVLLNEAGANTNLHLANVVFDIRLPDAHSPRNGPNSKGCAHGKIVDASDEFDGHFTCDCETTKFDGPNCDEAVDGPSRVTTALAAVLGTFVLAGVGIAAVFRIRIKQLQKRPINIGSMQDALLHGAINMDIAEHQFGITLQFDCVLRDTEAAGSRPISSAEQYLTGDYYEGDDEDMLLLDDMAATPADIVDSASLETDQLANVLIPMLTKACRKHPRLAASFRQAAFKVSDADRSRVLVVAPRPQSSSTNSDMLEWAVADVNTHIQQQLVMVGPAGVISASIAVAKRVPREIARNHLLRIGPLGNGAFGQVELYHLEVGSASKLPVAAKSLKPGATSGTDELLREAALMALLEHRNVIKLVGVVTCPRDLPPLILMECCHGTLLDRLQIDDDEDDRLSPPPPSSPLVGHRRSSLVSAEHLVYRLTYCTEILRGMQYLALRMIVHRDLAARNILLDTMDHCKVADFGMSATLDDGDGSQYARQYVRIHAEVALRWASPEALVDQRFSTASDVWAFGVTAWEIFSSGQNPYIDLGLGAVGAFVGGGGRLGPPADSCPEQIYTDLMTPCWAAEPEARPDFGQLYGIAVLYGGQEDNEADAERTDQWRNQTAVAQLVQDRNHDAPSVSYMKTAVLPMLIEAAAPIVEANLAGRVDPKDKHPIYNVQDCSSYQLKDLIVVPQTLAFACPRDRKAGSAYVDMMPREHVGTATAILSYAWRYPLRLVVGALEVWCTKAGLSPQEQFVWIDVICWNQHPGRLSDPVGEWTPRVTAIGHQLTMLHPWDRPIYVTRAWVRVSVAPTMPSTNAVSGVRHQPAYSESLPWPPPPSSCSCLLIVACSACSSSGTPSSSDTTASSPSSSPRRTRPTSKPLSIATDTRSSTTPLLQSMPRTRRHSARPIWPKSPTWCGAAQAGLPR